MLRRIKVDPCRRTIGQARGFMSHPLRVGFGRPPFSEAGLKTG
jgi:hypothetical protein